MTNEHIIEEILHEAAAHGLRTEVVEEAKKLREENKAIDAVSSYEIAFKTIINE